MVTHDPQQLDKLWKTLYSFEALRRIYFLSNEEKFRIFALICNILCVLPRTQALKKGLKACL